MLLPRAPQISYFPAGCAGTVDCAFITSTYGTGGLGDAFTWGSVNKPIADAWLGSGCSGVPIYTCQDISNWCVPRRPSFGL